MKRILFTIAFPVLFFLNSKGQITEYKTTGKEWLFYGQVKYVGPAKASLQYIVNAQDTTFLLMMWDERPELKSYFSITFNSNGSTLSSFYEILMSFFEKENWKNKDYIRIFKLGSEEVSVYKAAIIGAKSIMIKTTKGRIDLRKGEIEKLFNR